MRRRWDEVRHQTVSLLAAFLSAGRENPAPVDLQNFVAFQDGFDKLFKVVGEVRGIGANEQCCRPRWGAGAVCCSWRWWHGVVLVVSELCFFSCLAAIYKHMFE